MLIWITHSIYAIFSLIMQKYFIEFFFTVTSQTLIKYANHEKCVDPPTLRVRRNY